MIASYDCQKPKNATANWSLILPDYTESFKMSHKSVRYFETENKDQLIRESCPT